MTEGRTTTFRATGGIAETAAALGAAGFEVGRTAATTLTVLDTFDGRLGAAGLRLTADAVDGSTLGITLAAEGSVTVHATVDALPRVAADLPAGPLRARVDAVLDVRVLLPLFTIEATVVRAVDRNDTGKVTAALTLVGCDDVVLIEVHPLTGYERSARRAREVVGELGEPVAEDGRDAISVLAAGRDVDLSGTRIEPGVPLDPDVTAADGYRAVFANLLAAIVANRPGTVADLDPEFLHDLRVAVRRTRAVLAYAKGVFPADVLARARADFARLGTLTGPARDLDVYQIEWPTYVSDLDAAATAQLDAVRAHLADERLAAHHTLAEALESDEVTAALDWWGDWLARPSESDGPDDSARHADAPLGPLVAKRIRKAHRAMVADGRSIDEASPAEHLHELRKDAKKLRYLIECFGGLYHPAARKAFVSRLKALQDNLGEHQDAEVHAHQLSDLATRLAAGLPVPTVLAAGRLVERMEVRRADSRAEFTERFAEFDSAPTRQALRDLLDSGRGR